MGLLGIIRQEVLIAGTKMIFPTKTYMVGYIMHLQ